VLEIINENKLNDNELVLIKDILKDLEVNYISSLDLSEFKGIKIVDDNYLHQDSDGRLEKEQILLPCTKIKKALSNVYNDDYKKLRTTIYHELVHLDFKNKYPKLHNLYDELNLNEEYDKAIPIQIWAEFNAQKESEKIATESAIKIYFKSFCDYNWNLHNELDFIKLKKHLPYIIVRINGRHLNREKSLSLIRNDYVKKIIIRVEEILYKLSNLEYEDSYDFLKELCDYLELEQGKYN